MEVPDTLHGGSHAFEGGIYVLAFSNFLPLVDPSGIGVQMATFIVVGDPPRAEDIRDGFWLRISFLGLPASWRLREFWGTQKTKTLSAPQI